MPSYRVSCAVHDVQPGHRPEEVMAAAVDCVATFFTVEAQDLEMPRGQPRVSVRFSVPALGEEAENTAARSVEAAFADAVARVAVVSDIRLRRGVKGRWWPLDTPAP